MNTEQSPEVSLVDSTIYQDMLWCSNCGGTRIFLIDYEFDGGRVGCCLGCGDRRVAWFTRVTAEAA